MTELEKCRIIVRKRLRRIMLRNVIVSYTIIISFLVFVAILTDNPIGVAVMMATFFALRYTYKNGVTYHFDKIWQCIIVTCIIFGLASLILMAVNFWINLVLGPLLMAGLTLVLHKLGMGKEYEAKLEKINRLHKESEAKLQELNRLHQEKEIRAEELRAKTQEIEELRTKTQELELKSKEMFRFPTKLTLKELYCLDKDQLDEYCKRRGLSEIERDVAYCEFYCQLRMRDMVRELHFSRSHLDRLRTNICVKLDVPKPRSKLAK